MAQTEIYIWGGVDEDNVRLNQAETGDTWKFNQNTDALLERIAAIAEQAALFAQDDASTGLLVWGWQAGRARAGANVVQVLAGTIALTASVTNYVEVDPASGTVSVNQTGFSASKFPLRKLVCDAASITVNTDCRTWVQLPQPTAWPDITGKPATFSPSSHSHTIDALPVAASGVSDSTKLVRSDDARLTAATIADGSITDVLIGSRTCNDTDADISNTGLLTALLSRAFNRIKALKTTIDAATASATAFTLVYRNINGRFQAADPTSAQDVATKNYVDTGLSGKAVTSHVHSGADITSGTIATARLNVGTTVGTVAAGNHTHAAAAVGTAFVGTADKHVVNTTTNSSLNPTGLGTPDIQSSRFSIGTVVRLRMRGLISTKASGAGTITITFCVGDGVMCSTGAIAIGDNLTNQYWEIDTETTYRTVGIPCTVVATGTFRTQGATTDTFPFIYAPSPPPHTGSIRTAHCAAQWSVADTANDIVCQQATLEILN